ncbi:MAG: dynamin family protein [Oscillospiraceae bacterium]|nr:dynamin family protein [Oscillospiraceae bacterium]
MNGGNEERFYEERLVADAEATQKALTEALDELDVIRSGAAARGVMGAEFSEWLRKASADIKHRQNDTFNIVVVGDFKRGKSTLVNALLGEDAVHAGATPETATLNRITWDKERSIEAVLKNKRKVTLSRDELKRENLEKIMPNLPSPIGYIDIKIPLEILKDVRVVDTPGIGDLLKQFDNLVRDYILFADAVIYVVSALSPLSETEQAFLCAAILPQNVSKLFVVINMCDCLDDESEVERITALIRERTERIFTQSYIYPVSALDEVCRLKNLQRPNKKLEHMLGASFDELRTSINSQILDCRDIIQVDRLSSMLRRLFAEMEAKIAMLESALEIEAGNYSKILGDYENQNSDLVREIEAHKTRIHVAVSDMRREAEGWMSAFMERMKGEVQKANVFKLEQLEKHFHFYFIDMVREALMQCAQTHSRKVSEMMDESIQALWDTAAQKSLNRKIASVSSGIKWTSFDSVMMGAATAGEALPDLGLLTLIGQAALGFAKSKGAPKRTDVYTENILGNYPQITGQVLPQVEKIYADFNGYVDSQLEESYQKRLDESVNAIKQAQDISKRSGAERDEALAALEQLKSEVKRLSELF